MKSQNTVGKQITTLADQKKFADRESRLVPRKIKETIHSLNNPNQNSKISLMLPEIWLPHYGSSYLLIYVTSVDSNSMKLAHAHHICVRKALLSNYFS